MLLLEAHIVNAYLHLHVTDVLLDCSKWGKCAPNMRKLSCCVRKFHEDVTNLKYKHFWYLHVPIDEKNVHLLYGAFCKLSSFAFRSLTVKTESFQ